MVISNPDETSVVVTTPKRTPAPLADWNRARLALERASTIDEVKEIHDQAEALRLYARQSGQGLVMQQQIVSIKLRAERKAGDILATMPKHPPGPAPAAGENGAAPEEPLTLEQLGITKRQSANWQKVAAVPAEKFDAYIETGIEEGAELSTAGLLRFNRHGVHFSSESKEWYTPQPIIDRVLQTFDGVIDLDPCSNPGPARPVVPAARVYTAAENGLIQPWAGRVYMNPPYGRGKTGIEPWAHKFALAYEEEEMLAGIATVPARTDTDWWVQFRDGLVCFVNGRIKFGVGEAATASEHGAPFPTAIVFLGNDEAMRRRFVEAFNELGDIWERVR